MSNLPMNDNDAEMNFDIGMIDINEVIVQGPIVYKNVNDIATNLRIKVARANLPLTAGLLKEDAALFNYPEVSIYDPMLKVKAEAFDKGDEVKIRAFVSVSQKISKLTNRQYFDQKLVVVSIEPAEAIDVFPDDDVREIPSFCKFNLHGRISSIRKGNNALELNVCALTHDSVNNVQTFMYSSMIDDVLANYAPGDRVSIQGTIQTPKKDMNGVMVMKKNFVINKIKKLQKK